MDAFEALIAMLLQKEGFWVRTSFKVELTKEEKVSIGKPSSPRWELDIVAYKGATNELWLVECKSYLYSAGVNLTSFDGTDPKGASHYKLFNDRNLYRTVAERLVSQLTSSGACGPSPSVVLCLAAGRIRNEKDRQGLRSLFKDKGWLLFDEEWILNRLRAAAATGYENDIAVVVSKLLARR